MDKELTGSFRKPLDAYTRSVIPSAPGHSFDLPGGFFAVSPHRNPDWDVAGAYMPPCSGGSGNAYYMTVKAVYQSSGQNREFKLIEWTVLELGAY